MKWHGLRTGRTCNRTVINTAGSSPIVPERWPLRPSVFVLAGLIVLSPRTLPVSEAQLHPWLPRT
jgi:hypothetical protein